MVSILTQNTHIWIVNDSKYQYHRCSMKWIHKHNTLWLYFFISIIHSNQPRKKDQIKASFRCKYYIYLLGISLEVALKLEKLTFSNYLLFNYYTQKIQLNTKIKGAHWGKNQPVPLRGIKAFCHRAPKVWPDFRGRAKKQPVPWHGGTG